MHVTTDGPPWCGPRGPGRARAGAPGRGGRASGSGRRAVAPARRGARPALGGWPRLVVTADGAARASPAIRARLAHRTAPGLVTPGRRTLRVRLANPHRSVRCRRSVRVDRFVLAPSPGPRWTPGAAARPGSGSSATPVDISVAAAMYDIDLFDDARRASSRRCTPRAGVPSATSAPARSRTAARRRRASRPAVLGAAAGRLAGRALARRPRGSTSSGRSSSAGSTCARRRASTASRPTTSTATPTRTGFPLTARRPARASTASSPRAAHARGLSIGLKNDLDQVAALEPDFDWALNEQCFQYDECDRLRAVHRAPARRCSSPSTSSTTARFCAGRASGRADGDAQAPGARRLAPALLVTSTRSTGWARPRRPRPWSRR